MIQLNLSPGVKSLVPIEWIVAHQNDIIPCRIELSLDGARYTIDAKDPRTLGEVMRANKTKGGK